jgi:hypothetical protein
MPSSRSTRASLNELNPPRFVPFCRRFVRAFYKQIAQDENISFDDQFKNNTNTISCLVNGLRIKLSSSYLLFKEESKYDETIVLIVRNISDPLSDSQTVQILDRS